MDLFDDITRTEHRTPIAEDTKFSYLNASARPEAASVRKFLEDCLTRYPADHRDALVTRLRSIDTTHDAAVFKLDSRNADYGQRLRGGASSRFLNPGGRLFS
jgi:hypothetical protein